MRNSAIEELIRPVLQQSFCALIRPVRVQTRELEGGEILDDTEDMCGVERDGTGR